MILRMTDGSENDGSVRRTDGSVRRTNGSVRRTDGSVRRTGGSLRRSDGSVRRTDGSVRRTDGSVRRTAGSVRRTDGSVRRTDGILITGILIKKSLMFDLLDSDGDPGDNFLVVKARINNKTVILVSIYGPVAEAYTTQPNSKASSRVLYMYFSCMAG